MRYLAAIRDKLDFVAYPRPTSFFINTVIQYTVNHKKRNILFWL